MDQDAQVVIYDKGITRRAESRVAVGGDSPNGYAEFRFLTRAGDVVIPRFDHSEPLRNECRHFIDCIARTAKPGRRLLRRRGSSWRSSLPTA